MGELSFERSVVVRASPGAVYDLVSDVTRTREWSPVVTACWWDPGDGPRVGAEFTGRNEVPGRTWQTRSRVVVADPGREFAFVVGDGFVRWGFVLQEVPAGTSLTESWAFLPAGLAAFRERYGDDAPAQVADRTRQAHEGVPASLAAIRRLLEPSATDGVTGPAVPEVAGGEAPCRLDEVCPRCGSLGEEHDCPAP